MWTLVIITIVSLDPPSYYYNPVLMVDSLEKCEAIATNIRKTEKGKPIKLMCTKSII